MSLIFVFVSRNILVLRFFKFRIRDEHCYMYSKNHHPGSKDWLELVDDCLFLNVLKNDGKIANRISTEVEMKRARFLFFQFLFFCIFFVPVKRSWPKTQTRSWKNYEKVVNRTGELPDFVRMHRIHWRKTILFWILSIILFIFVT